MLVNFCHDLWLPFHRLFLFEQFSKGCGEKKDLYPHLSPGFEHVSFYFKIILHKSCTKWKEKELLIFLSVFSFFRWYFVKMQLELSRGSSACRGFAVCILLSSWQQPGTQWRQTVSHIGMFKQNKTWSYGKIQTHKRFRRTVY